MTPDVCSLCMPTRGPRGQRRVPDSPELQLEAVVNYSTWGLKFPGRQQVFASTGPSLQPCMIFLRVRPYLPIILQKILRKLLAIFLHITEELFSMIISHLLRKQTSVIIADSVCVRYSSKSCDMNSPIQSSAGPCATGVWPPYLRVKEPKAHEIEVSLIFYLHSSFHLSNVSFSRKPGHINN